MVDYLHKVYDLKKPDFVLYSEVTASLEGKVIKPSSVLSRTDVIGNSREEGDYDIELSADEDALPSSAIDQSIFGRVEAKKSCMNLDQMTVNIT